MIVKNLKDCDQLPFPAKSGSKYIVNVEIQNPDGGMLAAADKIKKETGNPYSTIKMLVRAYVKALKMSDGSTVTDKVSISGAVDLFYYNSGEYVIMKGAYLESPDEDFIEGIYHCPRCNKPIKSILIEAKTENQEDVDLRDRLSDLSVNCFDLSSIEDSEEVIANFIHELNEPVVFRHRQGNDEQIETIKTIEFRRATLHDCEVGYMSARANDDLDVQFSIYARTIVKVNGQDVDDSYRKTTGKKIMQSIKKPDLIKIFKKGREYGIDKSVPKYCNDPVCGKEFRQVLPLKGFFYTDQSLAT